MNFFRLQPKKSNWQKQSTVNMAHTNMDQFQILNEHIFVRHHHNLKKKNHIQTFLIIFAIISKLKWFIINDLSHYNFENDFQIMRKKTKSINKSSLIVGKLFDVLLSFRHYGLEWNRKPKKEKNVMKQHEMEAKDASSWNTQCHSSDLFNDRLMNFCLHRSADCQLRAQLNENKHLVKI